MELVLSATLGLLLLIDIVKCVMCLAILLYIHAHMFACTVVQNLKDLA